MLTKRGQWTIDSFIGGNEYTVDVPIGVLEDFTVKPNGWMGSRPAKCGNSWTLCDLYNDPGYVIGGVLRETPGHSYNDGGALHSEAPHTGDSGTYWVEVTNRDPSDDQAYWVFQILASGEEGFFPTNTEVNLQIEVSQRNMFVVWYYPGATFPTIYASGAGMPYSVTWRWYVDYTINSSNVSFTVRRSDLDGSNMTTVCSGTTGSDKPMGRCVSISGRDGNKFLRIGKGPNSWM